MSNNQNINTTLDSVFRTSSSGGTAASIGSVHYGINHQATPLPIPANRDAYGYTFFVRPQLNLSTQNLRAERRLLPLLSQLPDSIQRIIRTSLDPRLQINEPNLSCKHLDHQLPFIALLSNHALSINGWPDITLDTYTSKPGQYKEVFVIPDSTAHIYSTYDLNVTFRNMIGDPISTLIQDWIWYIAAVFEGTMVPYADFITENEMDYCSRIYRLVMDPSKRFVNKIACTGACFPIAVPMGNSFDYEVEKPFNEANDRISTQWRCIGARYNDPIIYHEFNKCVQIFNPTMSDRYRAQQMTRIPHGDLSLFNNLGAPRIDPDSKELQWWVVKDVYARVMADFDRHYAALGA